MLFELNKQKQPFFASTFTLSSHSPYDQPMKDVILGGGDEKGFLNSAYYTDRSLRNFLTKARKQSWYKNTLFVFVADHSHVTPRHWDYHDMNYRRIPLLFYGDVIKPEFRGTKVKRIASQVDIATTLLKQIDLPSVDFKWSRNLFNSNRKDYVFCAATNGFCWYYDTNYYAYDFILNESVVTNPPRTIPKEQDIKNGKSYLQLLFDEYLKK